MISEGQELFKILNVSLSTAFSVFETEITPFLVGQDFLLWVRSGNDTSRYWYNASSSRMAESTLFYKWHFTQFSHEKESTAWNAYDSRRLHLPLILLTEKPLNSLNWIVKVHDLGVPREAGNDDSQEERIETDRQA